MNLNLLDLSKSIKAEYTGQFYDTIHTIFNGIETNISNEMLDRESKSMNNRQLDGLKSLLGDNNIIDRVVENTGVSAEIVQKILSEITSTPELGDRLKENFMKGESVHFGDKFVEIINSGDGVTNNYANLMDNIGLIKDLKKRVAEQQQLLKDKDELIAAQRETIELLKSK